MILLLFTFLTSLTLQAQSHNSLAFQLEIGSPAISITNPDDSKANYDGLSTNFKALFPLLSGNIASANLMLGARYFDLKNTTLAAVEESAQMIGPGIGLDFQVYILNFGYSYYFMKARHQSIGLISNTLEYSFIQSGYHVGLMKIFKALGIGFLYTSTIGSIAAEETGLSKDSDFSENTYWLVFRYDFGTTTGQFLNNLIQ